MSEFSPLDFFFFFFLTFSIVNSISENLKCSIGEG